MDANVKKVLENNIWFIATSGEDSHVVPVGFKNVTDDGKLVVGAVFLKETVNNILNNGKISVAACDPKSMEAYEIVGTAEFVEEGPYVDPYHELAKQMFKGKLDARGALVITPKKIVVTSPTPDNKKELPL